MEDLNLILHITAAPGEQKKKIKISFFNEGDYHELQSGKGEFEYDAEEFTNAMTLSVSDKRSMSLKVVTQSISNTDLHEDQFFVIFFDRSRSEKVCKILRFTKRGQQSW